MSRCLQLLNGTKKICMLVCTHRDTATILRSSQLLGLHGGTPRRQRVNEHTSSNLWPETMKAGDDTVVGKWVGDFRFKKEISEKQTIQKTTTSCYF